MFNLKFIPRPSNYILFLLLASAFIQSVCSQRPGIRYPKWARHKYYWVSSERPITNHMVTQPYFNSTSILIAEHVSNVEKHVMNFLRSRSRPAPSQLFEACNVHNHAYENSVGGVFALRGWPDLYRSCVTDVIDAKLFKDKPPPHSVNQVYDAVVTRGESLERESGSLISLIQHTWAHSKLLVNWDNTGYTNVNFQWDRPSRRCVIHALGIARVGKKWYVASTLTNRPVLSAPKDFDRQFINEYTYVDEDGAKPETLNMIMPIYNSKEENYTSNNNTTTMFFRNRGQALPSSFSAIFPERNIALRSALEKADMDSQQVIDALAPSSLAILFLPVSLNLIPIYLITSVDDVKFFIHTLVSDVLSVVPLAVKGIELMVIGYRKHRSIGTRITHARNGSQSRAGAAELWAAQCQSMDRVLPVGILFFTLAVCFMVLGVIGEFWAKRFVTRRQEHRNGLMAMYVRIASDEHYDGEAYMSTISRPVP